MKKNSQEFTLIDISILGGEPVDCCHICGNEGHNKCSCCKGNICEYCTIEKNNDRKCYLCTSKQSRVEILDDLERCKTICIDFDGVLSDYRDGYQGEGKYGKPIPGVDRATRWLKDNGWFIIINTCRNEDEQIAEFCMQNNICFDEINKNPNQPKDCSDKPLADIYLDDKAIGFTGDWAQTLEKIENFRPWWKEPTESQNIKIFSQKEMCNDACDVCGEIIKGEKPLKYNEECYHRECLLNEREKVIMAAAKQIRELRVKKFDPLLRTAAEDNFSPSANNDSEIEDADDGAAEADPVEKGKKSTTKNLIDRDDTALHQDDPGKPTYPRDQHLTHRPRSLNE